LGALGGKGFGGYFKGGFLPVLVGKEEGAASRLSIDTVEVFGRRNPFNHLSANKIINQQQKYGDWHAIK
jgi:hypothetical protein